MTEITKTKTSISLATITGILLLSAVLVVPGLSLSALADHGHGGPGKKNHQKDREGDDKGEKGDGKGDKERCENGASAKYNKHCDENDDHEKDNGKGNEQVNHQSSVSNGKGHGKSIKED